MDHNEVEKIIASVPKSPDGSQVHSVVAHTVRAELRPLMDDLRKLIAELKEIKKSKG